MLFTATTNGITKGNPPRLLDESFILLIQDLYIGRQRSSLLEGLEDEANTVMRVPTQPMRRSGSWSCCIEDVMLHKHIKII